MRSEWLLLRLRPATCLWFTMVAQCNPTWISSGHGVKEVVKVKVILI